jgi:transcription elongation factor Elf1
LTVIKFTQTYGVGDIVKLTPKAAKAMEVSMVVITKLGGVAMGGVRTDFTVEVLEGKKICDVDIRVINATDIDRTVGHKEPEPEDPAFKDFCVCDVAQGYNAVPLDVEPGLRRWEITHTCPSGDKWVSTITVKDGRGFATKCGKCGAMFELPRVSTVVPVVAANTNPTRYKGTHACAFCKGDHTEWSEDQTVVLTVERAEMPLKSVQVKCGVCGRSMTLQRE